jgi:hypothetical protein
MADNDREAAVVRIGWATPLHHASVVGRFSVGVAEALARCGVGIDLLRSERIRALQQPRLPTRLKVRELARMSDFGLLSGYDLLVYNIGDDVALHQHAVDALLRIPGLCIFHDRAILKLFTGWMAGRGEVERIAAIITSLYGSGVYTAAAGQSDELSQQSLGAPMLEWLAPCALAAVAHGFHALKRLEASCSGPVRCFPPAQDLPEAVPPLRNRSPEDKLRLTMIGPMSDNTLAANIISVIGRSSRLREACACRLASPVSDGTRRELGRLTSRLGVSLDMIEPLSPPGLAEEIAEADAVLCLQLSAVEAGRAPVIQAIVSGRPTIIIDQDFCQHLGAGLVLTLAADFEDRGLADHLLWLLDRPEEARDLGLRAAAWARETFSFDAYASAFLPLAEQACEAEPLMRLGLQLGQELSSLGAGPNGPEVPRIAQLATDLFCPGGKLCPTS